MHWVPGYERVIGNEASDERAKEAAHECGSLPCDPPEFLHSPLLLNSTATKATYELILVVHHSTMFITKI